MSKLDKEQVLADFSAAYKKAHGKAPKVEDNNGWYSINGDKNIRLADVAELTAELSGKPAAKASAKKETGKKAAAAKKDTAKDKTKGAAKSTAKSAAKNSVKDKPKKAAPKKTAAKKSTAKKSATKKQNSSGGLTAKEQWKQHLEESNDARLPRGMQ
ncbi:hypothetical protein CWE13_01960 [Aliidiomarina shirensis]|uniref:Uncharacterized protein n=1 Tax=Aliidiomarina shirensis TaxID=1048642 RepID=A0A432WXE7_9GAMM|nr:hypothetical protein [Aliidiomarina shirensis]RUO38429.1 hypothetical protein CWE13_01960 [Aliidiomarina shirensis]